MKSSKEIREALDGWEGNVLTCYLDPVGIPTIGKGFTNRSAVLTAMLGQLKPGVTKITAEQSDKIFAAMLVEEYEPFVDMKGAAQHEFDVGVSTVWNLGPRSQTWNWAKLWRAGQKKEAAHYLATHYNTAGGKKLPGLVRRRREEAEILEFARYPSLDQYRIPPEGVARREVEQHEHFDADPVTFEAQQTLTRLGFDPGKIDGWYGRNTKAAVLLYQQGHPHLVNDGILGPATLAQLRRDADRLKKSAKKVAGSAGSTGAVGFLSGIPANYIAIGVGVVAIGAIIFFAWKYRDVWARRKNAALKQTIEV